MPVGRIQKRPFRVHQAGKIRLGVKKKNQYGKEHPSSTHYFVLDDVPELKEFYGEEPTELDIMFMSDDEEIVASNYLRMYKCENPREPNRAKRRNYLACAGEGEDPKTGNPTIASWYDLNQFPQDGLIQVTEQYAAQLNAEVNELRQILSNPEAIPESKTYLEKQLMRKAGILAGRVKPRYCSQKTCSDYMSKNCKETMILTFKVLRGPTIFGEYSIATSSKKAMNNIFNCLEDTRNIVKQTRPDLPYGKISGIPFKLKRIVEPVKYTDNAGRRKFKEHAILHLEVNSVFARQYGQELKSAVNHALLEAPPEHAVPAPDGDGRTPSEMVMDADLYPTAEETKAAIDAEAYSEQQIVNKEKWIEDPAVIEALGQWEAKQGKTIPIGKCKAIAKKYNSKEELLAAIRSHL